MSSKDEKKIIGERLREFGRKKYGSISALARALGYKENSLTSYLQGKAAPGPKLLRALEDLGCNTHYLLTGERYLNKEKLIDLIEDSGKSYSTIADLIGISTEELFNWLDELSERKSLRIEEAVKRALEPHLYAHEKQASNEVTTDEQLHTLRKAMIKAFADIENLKEEIENLKSIISKLERRLKGEAH